MIKQQIFLCGAALLLIAACAPSDPGSTIKGVSYNAEQIAQGRVYYEQTCAACHGVDGQGQFPEAPLEPDDSAHRPTMRRDTPGITVMNCCCGMW